MSAEAAQPIAWVVRPANWLVRRRWDALVRSHPAESLKAFILLANGPPFNSPDVGRFHGRMSQTSHGDERQYCRVSTEWLVEFVIKVAERVIELTRVYRFPGDTTP